MYKYIPKTNDVKAVCDMSGFNCNRSDMVKQWNGLLVHKDFAERRHPLDYPQKIRPENGVKDARPELPLEDQPSYTVAQLYQAAVGGL